MNTISFDQHKNINQLISNGFKKDQAHILNKIITNISHNTADKYTVKKDIKILAEKIDKILNEIEKIELRMIIKLGSMIAIAVGLICSLIAI